MDEPIDNTFDEKTLADAFNAHRERLLALATRRLNPVLAALADLAPNDRRILILRHFDGLGNGDCAEVLGIEPKAVSIRYARALERLHRRLLDLSCFQTKNRNSR